ncbi:MAG TPA: hypothetical protein VNL18_08155 [Gemmatimonadales bacterium]|nr:hypothetical protein [Gemmatimonadales bacterium]
MSSPRIATTAVWCTAISVGCAHMPPPAAGCSLPALYGAWNMDATAEPSGYRYTGTVHFAETGSRTELIGTSGEGTREPDNYPIDSLTVTADSVRFSFAPLGVRIEGRCTGRDTIAVRFILPQPPFPDIVGAGFLTRSGRE